jgi:hypothetical protein
MIKPVIIAATGTLTKCLQKHLEAVTGNYWIYSVQNTAVVGTSHLIRKVLQSETWSLNCGDRRWFRRTVRKRRLVTEDSK